MAFTNPKVSIIVPVFNSESFINRCLDSLLNQTLSEIEIILVNDGSTDNSENIIKEYQSKDSRVILINQGHKMQGAARNNGMSHAKGEYIGFVDSDDWVDVDYFEKLYSCAKKYNADLSIASSLRVGEGKSKWRLKIEREEFVTNMQEKCDKSNQAKNPSPTNRIYKRDMLEYNDIRWAEGVYCEDKLFTIKALYYSNGVSFTPGVCYYYYRNPLSTVYTSGKCKAHENDKNLAKIMVLNFLKENNVDISDKGFLAVSKIIRFFGIPLYKLKTGLQTKNIYTWHSNN